MSDTTAYDLHCENDENDTRIAPHERLDHTGNEAWYQNPYQIIAMISNFSTSYNVVNISQVLPILNQLQQAESSSSTNSSACASSLLAGMVLGQLMGGALGDSFLGRLGALKLVMVLQIVASLVSAALPNHENGDIYVTLALCRFMLGVGSGGVYPLAAVLSAEQGKTSGPEDKGDQGEQIRRVVLTFSMQGLGFVAVPLVSVLLLNFWGDNLDLVWRLILGLGAAPGIVLMILQWRLYHRSGHFSKSSGGLGALVGKGNSISDGTMNVEKGKTDRNTQQLTWWEAFRHESGLGRKIIGTAGTWCLFDVLFYGNTLFQPIVVKAAFGEATSNDTTYQLQKTAFDSLVLTSIALPGYALAGAIMGKRTACVTQTPRYVMLQGFAAMTVLYFIIGTTWSYLGQHHALLILCYGLTFFFSNYGPNTTTFILPSLLYSPECRTTWNGISAAAGKLGALLGATLFAPAAQAWGDDLVMLICAGLSIVCFFLTLFFVPEGDMSTDTAEIAAKPQETQTAIELT